MNYQIIRITEEPTFNDGAPGSDMRVEFKVGSDGPFYERFNKADFTAANVQLRLQQFTHELTQLKPQA